MNEENKTIRNIVIGMFAIISIAFGWQSGIIPTILGINSKKTPSSYTRNDDYETERSYGEYGDLDCDDFDTWREAQEFFEDEGGPSEDYHNLDRDGDGIACESLK